MEVHGKGTGDKYGQIDCVFCCITVPPLDQTH